MKILLILFIIIFIILVIYLHYTSEKAFKVAFMRERKSKANSLERLENWGILDKNIYKEIKEVNIKSQEGFNLKGYLIDKYKDSNKFIILIHGYTVSYHLNTPFAKLFLKEGYNVLLVDQRAHGDSEGKYTTYGYYENKDINRWIEFLETLREEELYIGLHGQSMGAATAVICGARNKKVKFVIDDCGYSDAKEEIRHEFSKVKFVPFFMVYWLLNLKVRIRCGFWIKEASPIKDIIKSDVPILFIHGDRDRRVPLAMALDMYKRRKRKGDLLMVVEGAEHLEAYPMKKEEYESKVKLFLSQLQK